MNMKVGDIVVGGLGMRTWFGEITYLDYESAKVKIFECEANITRSEVKHECKREFTRLTNKVRGSISISPCDLYKNFEVYNPNEEYFDFISDYYSDSDCESESDLV